MTSLASGSPARPLGPRLALDAWGVVVCGGASLRMGRDKALLELEGRTLLERAVETLRALVPDVLLACGAEPRYRELGLELVPDRHPGVGPLAGLLAALERIEEAGSSACLALACDMPGALSSVFERLTLRLVESGADACLLATPAGLEPLHAVYRTSVLPAVRASVERGERRLIAFHPGIRVATLGTWELEPAERDCARNVNRPEEFLAAGGRLP